MTRIIVLGAGMVGSVIAKDLAWDPDYHVTIADISEVSLERMKGSKKIDTIAADLSDPNTVGKLVSDYDMVCGAMPSRYGYQTLKAVIEAGKDFVDISFMPEDVLELDPLAKEKGVIVVFDCGVAPGMSHMLVGYASSMCDELRDVRIYVGGIPREKKEPWFYKAAFAPSDVLEEYTRKSIMRKNDSIVEKDALTDIELIEFPGAGILEAFNTDGLRSLVKTTRAWNMVEKTLRYPGHIDKIKVLKEAGFLDKKPIVIDGVEVSPLKITEALLFPQWKYNEGEEDLTAMRVVVDGTRDGKIVRYTWDLLDYYDRNTHTTSMARTTAFPCAIVARMVERGHFREHGVNPPENLGKVDGLLDSVLHELDKRGIAYLSRIEYV